VSQLEADASSKRLIEVAFPLREVSAESAREKSIRHGHISTLHIWWARRPLAACRAAIFEALVPDPDDPACPPAFRSLVEELVPSAYDCYDREGPHPPLRRRLLGFVADLCKWENSNNQDLLEIARRLIREANGGVPPKVLDPFAGGGSIPLEALRLGCETYASDLNPVAVLILKCTVEYPQRYGQPNSRPVPDYIHEMDQSEAETTGRRRLSEGDGSWAAAYRRNPLATDVRYWGRWVLERARQELAPYYPPDSGGKVPMAYFWARTARCPNPACGSQIPMIRQFVLANSARREVVLVPRVDRHGQVTFSVEANSQGSSESGRATTTRTGALCLSCGQPVEGKHLQREGQAGHHGETLLAVLLRQPDGKRVYRAAVPEDCEPTRAAEVRITELIQTAVDIPPIPHEELPYLRSIFNVRVYGIDTWGKMFNARQALGVAALTRGVAEAKSHLPSLVDRGYAECIVSYLSLLISKLADRNSRLCRWIPQTEAVGYTFSRQALGMIWDYVETCPLGDGPGNLQEIVDSIALAVEHAVIPSAPATVMLADATSLPHQSSEFAAIITDPPYYDAVPYSDLSDFFYVWLKRVLFDTHPGLFRTPLTSKESEIVQLAGRNARYAHKDKDFYEGKMAEAFGQIRRVTTSGGIGAIVFAHKTTDAWETLVSALVRSGLTVDASWPLHTERPGRLRAQEAAALESSVFLVCRPRPAEAGVAYLHEVSEELRSRIRERLDYFWAQGIRGADFFVSAIGPALEVYSRHAEVRTTAGDPVTVRDFLELVRREVIDYALAQVLHNGLGAVDNETRFYVLWRWAYGSAPLEAGEVITFVKPLGVELDELVRDGIVFKKGSKINLKSAADRADDDDLGLPRAGLPAPIVDCIHRCLNLWRPNRRQELADYLSTLGEARVEVLKRCAQALSEVLREDDPERRDLHAMLTGGLEPSMRRLL
jgi:adenine-specific DNA methylase